MANHRIPLSAASVPDKVPVPVPAPTADRRASTPGSDPLATDTPTDRVDAGAAWGTLVHGLLEHAMRHRDATRDELARLAKWLTVEHDDLRPSIPVALDTVEAVMHSDVWRDAQSSGELHVEVPFAVLLEEGTGPFSSASVPDKAPIPFSADRSMSGGTDGSVIPVAQGLSAASRDPGRTGSPEAGAGGRIPTVLRGVDAYSSVLYAPMKGIKHVRYTQTLA